MNYELLSHKIAFPEKCYMKFSFKKIRATRRKHIGTQKYLFPKGKPTFLLSFLLKSLSVFLEKSLPGNGIFLPGGLVPGKPRPTNKNLRRDFVTGGNCFSPSFSPKKELSLNWNVGLAHGYDRISNIIRYLYTAQFANFLKTNPHYFWRFLRLFFLGCQKFLSERVRTPF